MEISRSERASNSHQDQSLPLYIPAGFYMLRAPVLPANIFLRLSNTKHALQGEEQATLYTEEYHQVLRTLVEQPQIQLALALASPSLFRSIERFLDEKTSSAQIARISGGLLRYLIRMSTRPTPFGLFSGVAMGVFTTQTKLSLGEAVISRVRTRSDMNWLLSVIKHLEEKPELVSQLHVRANQAAYLAGDRFFLPSADTYGQQDKRAISLRATAVVQKTLELARGTFSYSLLAQKLHQLFPQASLSQIERLLWQLWEHHFLISDLHPPLTDTQPTRYLFQKLKSLTSIENEKSLLARVLETNADLDATGYHATIGQLDRLISAHEQFVEEKEKIQPPIQTDAALHLKSGELHHQVGQAAARAAELLLRLGPFPEGLPHLKEYRLHFVEKYGERTEVPLLDLLSPENGLDAPQGYTQPARTYGLLSLTRPTDTSLWDQTLQEMIIEAVHARIPEVELTEKLLCRLERWAPRKELAPRSLEIYLQLQAKSREALDQGEWFAVLGQNCGSPQAGRTFGRFSDLLDSQDIEQLRSVIKREEALMPDVLFAELSYQHQRARAGNVAFHPRLRSYEIVLGVTPSVSPDHVIPLSDLVVGVHNQRFYVRSLRLGKQVIACQSHMLNIQQAPNVCRFLLEVGFEGSPVLNSFNWGNMSNSPFLPRVIYREKPASTLVLSPAQWKVGKDTIEPQGTGDETMRWWRGLQVWRASWSVPRYVYLTEADNRLLLDLEHPMMAAELRRALNKLDERAKASLQELLPNFEHLWLQNEREEAYFAEIVVPLLRSDAADVHVQPRTDIIPQSMQRRAVKREERSFFPGDAWVYFKLYAATSQHNDLIAGPMRNLLRGLQNRHLIDGWFYLRYQDLQPHLRLRCHAKNTQDIPTILDEIMSWSRGLVEQGKMQSYNVDSYDREVERYGGPDAITIMEQVFYVDSVVISNIIMAQQAGQLILDPMEIAVFSMDRFFTDWGYDRAQCLQWLRKRTDLYAWSQEFRPSRKRYCELLSPWEIQSDQELVSQRELLGNLMEPQSGPLRQAGTRVRALSEAGELWTEEDALLGSLAHMHKIRLLNLDRQQEEQIYAFWRHTLESINRRPRH